MSLWRYQGIMRENEFSRFGKVLILALLAGLVVSAGMNIARGMAPHPAAFVLAMLGFSLFLIAKVSVLRQQRWISFGTRAMSGTMATLYRFGYWFMAMGLLVTFG
jgi:hypothetical protein